MSRPPNFREVDYDDCTNCEFVKYEETCQCCPGWYECLLHHEGVAAEFICDSYKRKS